MQLFLLFINLIVGIIIIYLQNKIIKRQKTIVKNLEVLRDWLIAISDKLKEEDSKKE